MPPSATQPHLLSTTAGDLPLHEYHLRLNGHAWSILHTGAVRIALWPAAIALAHELASRSLNGKRVLELGAGTGLPGIVAASCGAHVVQTDRQEPGITSIPSPRGLDRRATGRKRCARTQRLRTAPRGNPSSG